MAVDKQFVPSVEDVGINKGPHVHEKDDLAHERTTTRVIFSGFLSNFATVGITLCYGFFLEHYQNTLFPSQHPSTLALVGGLQTFIIHVGSAVHVEKKICPPHCIMMIGAASCLVSWLWLSFTNSFLQILASQGILFGVGSCMIRHPGMQLLNKFRRLHSGRVAALISCGSLIGGLFWSIAIRLLLDAIAVYWTYRVIGFISFALSAASCIALPRDHTAIVPDGSPDHVSPLEKSSTLRHILLSFAMLGIYVGISVIIPFAVLFGVDHGLSTTSASYSLPLFFFVSVIGYAASFALEKHVSSIYLCVLATAATGLLTVALPIMITLSTICTYFSILGLILGGVLARASTNSLQFISGDGLICRCARIFSFLGFLCGGPICGLLLKESKGGWFGSLFFSSGAFLFGSVALLFVGGYWFPDADTVITSRGSPA